MCLLKSYKLLPSAWETHYAETGKETVQCEGWGVNEKCPLQAYIFEHSSPAGVTVWVGLGPFRRLSLAGGSDQIRDTVHHDEGRGLRFCCPTQLPVHSLLLTESNVTRLFIDPPLHNYFPIVTDCVPA